MSLITEAVVKFEQVTAGSGCDDCGVAIRRSPDAQVCNYVKGVPLEAQFGGRQAQLVSQHPVQVTTRPEFMHGRPLATPEQRTAALCIINAVLGFLCLSRVTRACDPASHVPCYAGLADRLRGSAVYCCGSMPVLERELAAAVVDDPMQADIVLVNGDGLISGEGLSVVERVRGEKPLLLLGPGTAGLAILLDLDHWCPYGR